MKFETEPQGTAFLDFVKNCKNSGRKSEKVYNVKSE